MPSPPVLSRPLHRGSSLSAPPGGARSQRKRRICTNVSGVDTALSLEEGRWTASPAPASPGWAGGAQAGREKPSGVRAAGLVTSLELPFFPVPQVKARKCSLKQQ